MALFWPDQYSGHLIGGFSGGQQHATLHTRALDGTVQAQGLYPDVGLERFRFKVEPVDRVGERIIREDFLRLARGRKNPFYLFDHPDGRDYGTLTVLGTYASGGTLIIAAKDLTALSDVKADGVAVTAGYTYTNSIGPGGETRINFAAPNPAADEVITGVYSGRKRYRMELLNDFVSYEPFAGGATEPRMWVFELDVQERPGPDLA